MGVLLPWPAGSGTAESKSRVCWPFGAASKTGARFRWRIFRTIKGPADLVDKDADLVVPADVDPADLVDADPVDLVDVDPVDAAVTPGIRATACMRT